MPRWTDTRPLDGFVRDGHTWRLAFDAEPAPDAHLVFDGIATIFEVALNGEVVLRGDSMFRRYEVAVGPLLRAAGNELEIRCTPLEEVLPTLPRRPRQRWRTKVVSDGALRWVRTAIVGRAPGFAPGPPIEGPWRPVWLVRGRLPEYRLVTRLEGADGVVTAHEPDGSVTEVRVRAAEPWWPHTHGEPALHEVELRLGDVTVRERVGFRALSWRDDPLALRVNDVPVFVRGAVWTPNDEPRATLEALRDAGLNCVRIAGTMVYEDETFHDLCDELGMLVWQDFMYANLDYPFEDEVFAAACEDEAREVLARVAGRPSTAVLCGNSEVEQQAAMFGVDPALGRPAFFGETLPRLAREAGWDGPYVPSAPSGGPLPFSPSYGVASYFGVGGYRRPLSDARTANVGFAAECLALANVPDYDVEHREGVMSDPGTDWDFADVRDHYLRELHGVDPDALRAEDPERYWALSREVSGEVMAAVFGEWRREGSPCAGGIVLWARDLLHGSGWGLLDHEGRPKAVLRALRGVLAPVAVWITDEGLGGLDAHVANDGPWQLVGELHVALLAGEHVVAEGKDFVTLEEPPSVQRFNVEGILGRFADASYAYQFGPPAHDTVVAKLWSGGAVVAQARWRVRG